ncbi:MAG: sulfotransferase family 2 domain-containing protein [Arenicella sp.]|jgi:hypothetical protein|nr:sulfotransferase family 2 domain-containing protein [Arenicella sp.]HAU66790.1 hypothetical protein [Gammaproteobacteria bacterium]
MNLSTIYKFAFLCVPKTGSTSLKNVLRDHSTISYGWKHRFKHMKAQVFHDHVMTFHKSAFPTLQIESSCVMREPNDWAYSWYRYRQRPELLTRSPRKAAMYTGDISFETFVDHLTRPRSHGNKAFAKIGFQHRYILMDDGSMGVDKIFRYEDGFGVIEDYFSQKIGTEISIPNLNKSPNPALAISDELLVRLENHFDKDWSIYNSIPVQTS